MDLVEQIRELEPFINKRARYWSRVSRSCLAHEDLVAEAHLRMCQSPPYTGKRSKLITYHYIRIDGAMHDALRRETKWSRKDGEPLRSGEFPLEWLADYPKTETPAELMDTTTTAAADRMFDRAELDWALDQLPGRESRIIQERYDQDRPIVDIATDIGVTRGRVSQLLEVGKQAMRRSIIADRNATDSLCGHPGAGAV